MILNVIKSGVETELENKVVRENIMDWCVYWKAEWQRDILHPLLHSWSAYNSHRWVGQGWSLKPTNPPPIPCSTQGHKHWSCQSSLNLNHALLIQHVVIPSCELKRFFIVQPWAKSIFIKNFIFILLITQIYSRRFHRNSVGIWHFA